MRAPALRPRDLARTSRDAGATGQGLVTTDDDGTVVPFAYDALNDSGFAGATFSPDGRTLYVDIQDPGLTLAIRGLGRSGR